MGDDLDSGHFFCFVDDHQWTPQYNREILQLPLSDEKTEVPHFYTSITENNAASNCENHAVAANQNHPLTHRNGIELQRLQLC